MLLGLNGVVEARHMTPGRFYLFENFSGSYSLFQCVKTQEQVDDKRKLVAVQYAPDTATPLAIQALPEYGPVVELGDVMVRVDAPSAFGSNMTSSIRAGSFIVVGNEAFIAVPRFNRGWMLVNIATGAEQPEAFNLPWVSFSRWLLVIEDNGEEIPIASFGEDA